MRRGWAASGIILAFLGGCASTRAGTTWEQDQAEGVTTNDRLVPTTNELGGFRRSVSIMGNAPPTENYLELANKLELAILQFTSARRSIAAEEPARDPGEWPDRMRGAWSGLIVTLDEGLSRPPGVLPRRLLIQARVTLDVELDTTARKYGPPPRTIQSGVTQVFIKVAAHMRAQPKFKDDTKKIDVEIALHWPVSPLILTSPFGYRRDPILGETEVRFHAGVDLGGSQGDLVSAAAPGRVVSAGWTGGHGRMVVVQHAGGFSTSYAHLRDLLVKPGMAVETGTPLGLMGSSGRSTGPHLHFEVHKGGLPIDPLEAISLEAPGFASN